MPIRKNLQPNQTTQPKVNNLELYLEKIPSLKNAVVKLMTSDYSHFLVDANVISKKPFTIKFKTKNGYYFELFVENNSYRCKVSGKKYDLSVEGEVDKASKGITELLSLGKPEPPMQNPEENNGMEGDLDKGLGGGSGGNLGNLPEPDGEDTENTDDETFVPIDDKGTQNIQGNNNLPQNNNT